MLSIYVYILPRQIISVDNGDLPSVVWSTTHVNSSDTRYTNSIKGKNCNVLYVVPLSRQGHVMSLYNCEKPLRDLSIKVGYSTLKQLRWDFTFTTLHKWLGQWFIFASLWSRKGYIWYIYYKTSPFINFTLCCYHLVNFSKSRWILYQSRNSCQLQLSRYIFSSVGTYMYLVASIGIQHLFNFKSLKALEFLNYLT